MYWRTMFQIAATYVGAVMGAGFASGQEIQQFFVRFGAWGLVGIALSAGLFAFLGWIMLDLQEKWNIRSYAEFFEKLLGDYWGRKADILVSILLFMGMVAMFSGSGALFWQYFGLSSWLGVILTSLVVFLALWFKGEGVLWINTVLIPLKFVLCLGIAIAAILWAGGGEGEGMTISPSPLIRNWALSALLYVSFNLTLAVVVFASLGRDVQIPGARLGAIMGGLALGMFAMVIGAALLRFPEVLGLEIPMVAVAGKLGNLTAFLYVVVLWLAMTTAAIGNGFSLVIRLVDTGRVKYETAMLVLFVCVLPLSGIQFSRLVEVGYPIFGYLGLVFLPFLFYFWRQS